MHDEYGYGVEPTKKEKDFAEKSSYEKLFLYMEAEERGEEIEMTDIKNEELLTVRTEPPKKNKKEDKEKKDKKSRKDIKFEKLKTQVEELNIKRNDDPAYVPSKKESKVLKKYNAEVLQRRKQEIDDGIKKIKNKNKDMNKRKKAKTFIPKTSQDTIPYIADYDNGLFEVEEGKFSKTFILKDLNFETAKEEEQVSIFLKWGEFVNYFGEDVFFSVTIDNRVIGKSEQKENILYKMANDDFDVHRTEYNKILEIAMSKSRNNIRQRKYFTLTLSANSPYEAEVRFRRMETRIRKNLENIGGGCKLMSTNERLELLHDKFRKGKEGTFKIDYKLLKQQGLSSKDYIAPTSFWGFNKKDYFMIENEYYRCLYISNLPTSLSTEFIKEFVDVDFPIMTTMAVEPITPDKAQKMIDRQLAGIETEEQSREKRAMKAGYSRAYMPRKLQQSKEQTEILAKDVTTNSQKMFFVTICCMVHGSSLDELNENCEVVKGTARKYTCQLSEFDYQQEDAMKITLPMGINPRKKTYVDKALTTESTAVFIPFTMTDIFDKNGVYMGINPISNNIIMLDRKQLKTPSGFILGSSGSGKSFACKREIINVLLEDSKTSVLIIDPEGEYVGFCIAFGGTAITISSGNDVCINPMDMDENYGLDEKDDPLTTPIEIKKKKALTKKSDYLMSICQAMLKDDNGMGLITPAQKSIIDRCIRNIYNNYLEHNFDENYLPTLLDLQEELEAQRLVSDEARIVAEAMEYYTKGSMDNFAHKTNVDYNNRFVVFNIRDLGEQLTQIALLVVMDFIWNRMVHNFQNKIYTYTYVDEIHVLFRNDYAANYLRQLYKRGRKFGLIITGITQDVEDLLRSEIARGMIRNSDFIVMLSQSSENQKILTEMLNLSEEQLKYIDRVESGNGLISAGKIIVPFEDQFPENSYLYKLISTKFGEDRFSNNEEIIEYVEQLITEHKKNEYKEVV